MDNILFDILLVFLLLAISGFFASSEIIFFGASNIIEEKDKRFYKRIIESIFKDPQALLVSMLIGNEFVNVLISSISSAFVIKAIGKRWVFLSGIFVSVLIFLLGETIPKNIALFVKDKLLKIYAVLFYPYLVVVKPFAYIFVVPVKKILKLFGVDNISLEKKFSLEHIVYIMQNPANAEEFSEEETQMIQKVSQMRETIVREIMTPRLDIFMLEATKTVKEVIRDILESEHSRIPIYKDTKDNVVGYIHIKDLMPVYQHKDDTLESFLRPIEFIPEVMSIKNLLQEMKKSSNQIMMVVDEHGAISGLITKHDLLEWLAGDLPQEWEEEDEFTKMSSDVYIVEGSASIEEVAGIVGFELSENYDYDTLSGFIMANMGKIPKEGDEFEYQGFKFIVDKMDGKKIEHVLIKIPANKDTDS
ncbi:hemolysin family protein [Hydrogenobaculum acidophilum]